MAASSLVACAIAPASLDERLDIVLDRAELPAIAAAVVDSRGIVALESAGVHRIGGTAPVSAESRFHVGSLAKPMTATMLATLIDDGILSWDTTVGELIDGGIHPGMREVTLAQLVSHHAGVAPLNTLVQIRQVPVFFGSLADQRLAFAQWLLEQEPELDAGTGDRYSNAGPAIAAAMAERATGQSWEDLMRARVFAPLGMDSAGFGWPARNGRHEPWGHWVIDGRLVPHDPDGRYTLPAWMGPSGDLHMNIRDLARFAYLHLRGLRGESTAILGPDRIATMHERIGDYSALGWGRIDIFGRPASIHVGSAGTFNALLIISPAVDRALAIVTNAGGDEAEEAMHALASGLLSSGP